MHSYVRTRAHNHALSHIIYRSVLRV